jgi:hypothetical protein
LFGICLKLYFKDPNIFLQTSHDLKLIFGNRNDWSPKQKSLIVRAVSLSLFLHGSHLHTAKTDGFRDLEIMYENLFFLSTLLVEGDLDPIDAEAAESAIHRASLFLLPFFDPYLSEDSRLTMHYTSIGFPEISGIKEDLRIRYMNFFVKNKAMFRRIALEKRPQQNELSVNDADMGWAGIFIPFYKEGATKGFEEFLTPLIEAPLTATVDQIFLNRRLHEEAAAQLLAALKSDSSRTYYKIQYAQELFSRYLNSLEKLEMDPRYLWPVSGVSGARLAEKLSRTENDFTPDVAAAFVADAFAGQHGKTGRIRIGAEFFRSRVDRSTGELVVSGFGRELLRTRDWKKGANRKRGAVASTGLSLTDFKIALQKSFDAVKSLPPAPSLDAKKALVVINLESLNSGAREFDGMILPLLARELDYAHRRSYGKEAKFLLIGKPASLELAGARLADYFKGGQDFIYTVENQIPEEYARRKAFVTDPSNPRPGRNFYAHVPVEGDVPNLRAALRLAPDLARIEELSVNDPDFVRLKQGLELFLGEPIKSVADFIAAIEAVSKNAGRYSLPALAQVPAALAIAAARLACRMVEQSA